MTTKVYSFNTDDREKFDHAARLHHEGHEQVATQALGLVAYRGL